MFSFHVETQHYFSSPWLVLLPRTIGRVRFGWFELYRRTSLPRLKFVFHSVSPPVGHSSGEVLTVRSGGELTISDARRNNHARSSWASSCCCVFSGASSSRVSRSGPGLARRRRPRIPTNCRPVSALLPIVLVILLFNVLKKNAVKAACHYITLKKISQLFSPPTTWTLRGRK